MCDLKKGTLRSLKITKRAGTCPAPPVHSKLNNVEKNIQKEKLVETLVFLQAACCL